MKIKFKNYLLIILIAVLCITCCLSFVFMGKNAEAQSSEVKNIICEEDYVDHDIKDGATTGSCYPYDGINTLALDNISYCNEYCSSHGPGREAGGVNILSDGCRNYMQNGFKYGSTDIAYWINMEKINEISNSEHRQKILSDIRTQTAMWNQAYMYDGTGQIVNIYEVNSNAGKPSSINGNKVIEVLPYDFTTDPDYSKAVGLFTHNERTVKINYSNNQIDYNIDTIVHEFGHVLGLRDLDSANKVNNGTHKTLMGYSRGTTTATLSEAIKYPDIQGIAVTTGQHVCQDSHFTRYIKVGNEYRHICFYCDRIDNRTSIISSSKAMASNVNCTHEYKIMVSCGEREWYKCTKCYKVSQKYTLTLDNEISKTTQDLYYGDEVSVSIAPTRPHYEFDGYYTGKNGTGTKYIGAKIVYNSNGSYSYYALVPDNCGICWYGASDLTLYANWLPLITNYTYSIYQSGGGGLITTKPITIESGKAIKLTAPAIDGYTFTKWQINDTDYSDGATVTLTLHISANTGQITIYKGGAGPATNTDGYIYAYYEKNECVAEGSLITLADGSQKEVQNLTGEENLLVWNLQTGTFDTAPILFIDSEPLNLYDVINLTFSDGTVVKVIGEHAFWDINLNQYVYLNSTAEKYIGHYFNKLNKDSAWTEVQLTGVEIQKEYTTAWSPVTYGHLCYYVNGMLSIPGGIGGLFNIFEVNPETMQYDEVAMQADIVEYGLFTYEEFAEILPVSEAVFNAFNAQYFKVAMGKGLLDYNVLQNLVERYSEYLNEI